MTRTTTLEHEFVEYMPDILTEGVLYVSIPFATAVHLCCCGCGNEVVTPLTPTDWQLIFDGETVSLHPSVGSWSLDCKSHYWISHNRVKWSDPWTQAEINKARTQDRSAKDRWYDEHASEVLAERPEPETTDSDLTARLGRIKRLRGWFRRKRLGGPSQGRKA
jgi:hypothetical protein